MKTKYSIIALFVASVMATACNEDFNENVTPPQSWEQEGLVTLPTITATQVSSINLAEAEDSVKVVSFTEPTLPEGTTLTNYSIVFVPNSEGTEKRASLETDANGMVTKVGLQGVVEQFYGKRPEERTLTATLQVNLMKEGQASLLYANSVTLLVTPEGSFAPLSYYLVGNLQGWSNDAKTCMLYPVDETKQSYTTEFSNGGGTPNFKMWLGSDFGNWDNVYGSAASDNDTSDTGTLKLGGGAIQTATNEYYTFTFDSSSLTYTLELLENQTPTDYVNISLIGDFNNWGGDADFVQTTPHNWYLEAIALSGSLKIRANHDWGTNWGANQNIGDLNYGVGKPGGDNLAVPTGTYNVFFNDITAQFVFVTVE